MSKLNRVNELKSDLLSTTALHIFPGHISSPRLQMFNSHLTQALCVKDSTERRCFTGMEPKFGEHTFGLRLDNDIHVIKAIQRYPNTVGMHRIRENPETVVIYEYDKILPDGRMTKEVDCMSLNTHHSLHQNFGYRYNQMNSISEYMAKDTVILQSPSIAENGNYKFGLEANVAMMSVPQIIEDGVVASKSFCERMTTTCIETYTVSWGKKKFPLNIHGDYEHYKPHPEIGDVVGEDGILMALRKYDDEISPVTMSRSALRNPDFKYDECTYVKPGAKVIDVRVHHDKRLRGAIRGKGMNTPVGMYDQSERYLTAETFFYQQILNVYNRLYASRKDSLNLGPNFGRLLVEAKAATATGDKLRMVRTYRGVPIDEWRVDITLEYPITPTIGFKLTGCHGDKGVICDVWEDEDMPIDAAGNRAELIVDGQSTISRMNVSRTFEQYLNACSWKVSDTVRKMVADKTSRKKISEYLLPYYHIVNQQMPGLVVDDKGLVSESHIENIVKDGIYLWTPTDNQAEASEVIQELSEKYPPVFDKVTYRGMSGNIVTTASDILIGSMYIMLLEKTGHKSSAGVSSSKLSHFGVPAKLTSIDRHSAPSRNQPIRFGESEGRLFVAMVGGTETAEMFDRTNNPVVRKVIQDKLLREENPTNIDIMVDRKKYPSGRGRILSLVRHFGECAGWRFNREVRHND